MSASAIFRNSTIMAIKTLIMYKRIFNTKICSVIKYGAEIWGGGGGGRNGAATGVPSAPVL